MDINKAYAKVKALPNRNVLLECIDLEDHWAFFFHKEALDPDEVVYGGGFDAVNKTTGEIMNISSRPENWEMLDKGERIDIEQFSNLR